MNQNQSAAEEILKSFKYMMEQALLGTTKIYDGIVVSRDEKEYTNKWNIKYNGEVHLVKLYGSTPPQKGMMVKVYVPQGNHSIAWFINQYDPYPIGAVYISAEDVSPAQLFGGSWKRIEDVFILAGGSKWAPGSTGGKDTHEHTLDGLARIYPATNGMYIDWRNSGGWESTYSLKTGARSMETMRSYGGAALAGKATAADSMPPYKAFYVWQRIA